MANIGEQLTSPESGMKRIDDTFYAFNYKNINMEAYTNKPTDATNYHNKTIHYNWDSCEGYIEFYIYSTSLYVLATDWVDGSESTLYIDGREIGTYGVASCPQAKPQTIYHKVDNLEKKIHHCKLVINTNAYGFDCIDIDEDGYMVYCDENGKLYYDVTPIMTSNNTPSPYIVTYNSEHVSGKFSGWKAFDKQIGDESNGYGWATDSGITNGYITLYIGDNIKINSFKIIPRQGVVNQAPKNFVLQGSNDNISFNDIKIFSNITDWTNEGKIFKLNKIESYKYYKLNVTENNGGVAVGISELIYLLDVSTSFYLIQDNSTNKIYNYDEENNQLVEVTDTSILKENALNNICIDDLTKVKDLINLTDDNITILSNQNSKLIVNGIKSDKELIISNQNLSIVNAETIHNFLFNITKIANGNCKFVISADNGQTWLSWNGSSWDTLINTAPLDNNNKIKQYSKLSDSEKIQWNKLRDEIWTSGMSTDITDVDYNSILTNKTIRFAFVLYRPTYDDNVTLKDTKWLYDKVGSWHKLSEDDIDIAINSNMCTVTPKLQNLEHVKVNILL